MKKGHIVLLVFSIITTALTIVAFSVSTMFFVLSAKGAEEEKAGAEVLGLLFYVIFNMGTLLAGTSNFILNLIQLIKTKKVYAIIMFIFACLLLAATIGMFIYTLVR